MSKDNIGDRMKAYEDASNFSLLTNIPIIARLDGRAFHTYTRKLGGYSEDFNCAMNSVAIAMHEKFNCQFSYVQSDEISLVIMPPQTSLFDGRIQKLTSILSAYCSVYFNDCAPQVDGIIPVFDCRVFNVPDKHEVANAIYWRLLDCKRNAVSMIARELFSHNKCMNKSTNTLTEMIINYNNEMGVEGTLLENFYPHRRLYGYARHTRIVNRCVYYDEFAKLPLNHPARTNPKLTFDRREIHFIDFWKAKTHEERLQLIFP